MIVMTVARSTAPHHGSPRTVGTTDCWSAGRAELPEDRENTLRRYRLVGPSRSIPAREFAAHHRIGDVDLTVASTGLGDLSELFVRPVDTERASISDSFRAVTPRRESMAPTAEL